MSAEVDLAKLSVSDFASHLDAVFEMQAAGAVVPLKLAKAESVGQAIRDGGAFSLLFLAPSGPFLPQAIYPVRHPTLGRLDIFLVPIGPVSGGNGYQAVFT